MSTPNHAQPNTPTWKCYTLCDLLHLLMKDKPASASVSAAKTAICEEFQHRYEVLERIACILETKEGKKEAIKKQSKAKEETETKKESETKAPALQTTEAAVLKEVIRDLVEQDAVLRTYLCFVAAQPRFPYNRAYLGELVEGYIDSLVRSCLFLQRALKSVHQMLPDFQDKEGLVVEFHDFLDFSFPGKEPWVEVAVKWERFGNLLKVGKEFSVKAIWGTSTLLCCRTDKDFPKDFKSHVCSIVKGAVPEKMAPEKEEKHDEGKN